MLAIFSGLYIVLFLMVFTISIFVVYHLLKYSVSKRSAYIHITIFLGVLLLLMLFNVYQFTQIELPNSLNNITPTRF